ncbi:serine/threonine-protein kinase 11-interacting protein-like [Ruditapes philippinarum]|uniref:serine/threonine-protein kinase 11-interacting protein-like n=1 Tax=Ruditapes philippinarum TaxID=129788 RepID=UPI00295BCDD1|nr:serine/threonine-protein kinase 11-interacting protein-like [Ruditapes philippinarum]
MKEEVIKSLLVISTHRIIIFRIGVESAASTDWLKSYENQPISELRYIDIGLGYQTLRLEFETECSSYTLLIADEGKCKQFLTLISDIVAHSDHSHLEGIGKSNPTTYTNLENQVLKADDNSSYQKLVSFLMLKYTHANTDEKVRKSLAITQTDLVLIDENHQWPLPRLQASLAGAIKKRQFTIVWREKINNIGTLSFNEFNPKELKLSFLEPTAFGNPSTWIISFETMKGVKSFVDAIRGPWEAEFGISLDISSVAFADSENISVA